MRTEEDQFTSTYSEIVQHFCDHEAVRALVQALGHKAPIAAIGSVGSSTAITTCAIIRESQRGVLLVTAHLDDADEAHDELRSLGVPAVVLPALEILPGETGVAIDLWAMRVHAVRAVASGALPGWSADQPTQSGQPAVLIAPIQALMQRLPLLDAVEQATLTLERGSELDLEQLTQWLAEAGYTRRETVEEPGEFAIRGGIIDILPVESTARAWSSRDGALVPMHIAGAALSGSASTSAQGGGIRIDLFGDEIDAINEFDLESMGSGAAVQRAELVSPNAVENATMLDHDTSVSLFDVLGASTPDVNRRPIAILSDTLEATEQARGYYERVTDARSIDGPPEVLKRLSTECSSFVEINASDAGPPAGAARVEIPLESLPPFPTVASEAVELLGALAADPLNRVVVTCQEGGEASRLQELVHEFASEHASAIRIETRYIHRGCVLSGTTSDVPTLILVPYHELLHRFGTRRRIRRVAGGGQSGSVEGRQTGVGREAFIELGVGDTVVHEDHGIARFIGLQTMGASAATDTQAKATDDVLAARPKLKGKTKHSRDTPDATVTEEFLTLEFAKGAKLHVPVSQIDKVQKYIGTTGRSSKAGKAGGRGGPTLSTLGGKRWQTQKDSVKESVRDLAAEMLRVQAARSSMPGVRYPQDTSWQREFEAEFPFNETQDQLAALIAIKKDMADPTPMDRLLCGDVGYGKTEVAIRAAFKAVEYGKQVAVLVPTTILAEQHERTFKNRFAPYPFNVASLSRFKTTSQQNEILKRTRQGQVDILIGTHRLLSKDVKFNDLGFVIVDEEQKFGVEHKQKLLSLRATVDVLTLSATPIPRTLHMSMLGLRDISSLSTPPVDRRAVVTEVTPYNEKRIKNAITRELARDGQVFFVHNRVHNIQTVADELQKLAPDARIVIGHGQMPDGELEQVMHTFVNHEADILVSTTIIETGLDIPTANTMFINDANMFGLADLHQLRGRVGRYKHRAYCYLLLPNHKPISEVARKRLRAVEEFSMLGAGFKIAMRDLEIRGAGNLLGAEQSGHIAAVGYEMYCALLEEAAHELKGEVRTTASGCLVEIGVKGALPARYIPSDVRRLSAYRRVARAESPQVIDQIEIDLEAAYGNLPAPASELLDVARVRAGASAIGVRSIVRKGEDIVFRAEHPDRVEHAMSGAAGSIRTLSARSSEGYAETYYRPPESYLEPVTLLTMLRRRFTQDDPDQN